jgi:hypothetical protein
MKSVMVLLGLLLMGAQAQAAVLDAPVPDNAAIMFDGLQWAWGGPCPYSGGCAFPGDLSYQGPLGWRLPTFTEVAALPADFASDFVFPTANVPNGGTDPISGAEFTPSPGAVAACAAPYFNVVLSKCDWTDGVNSDWAGATNADKFAEQLYVRAVPEPASLVVLSAAILGLGLTRRRC